MKKKTLAESFENTLLDYIRSENLSPGDALPKEIELASEFNVSRQVIREGLAGLKTFGILEPRKRRGMVLKRPNAFAGVSKIAQARLFSRDECREFMEIRIFMELGMAEFISARKSPDDIRELRRLAERSGTAPGVENEIAFHHKLFTIGGNSLAGEFFKIISTAFSPVKAPSVPQSDLPGHLELCDVLENGPHQDFYETLKGHFAPYLNKI
ncbi:MAG: FadR family transcriptional regulator [Lentisphaeria bacterium]|nr:FadR family transcriptional regulator [Lentisphaeria bacterium]